MKSWKDVRASMEQDVPFTPIPTGMELVPVVGLTFVEDYPGNILGLRRNDYSSIPVVLKRNPENKYDANAIEVHADNKMIGHIPKDVAARLAPKMDEGIVYSVHVFGVRVSPDNPMNPGVDLAVGVRRYGD